MPSAKKSPPSSTQPSQGDDIPSVIAETSIVDLSQIRTPAMSPVSTAPGLLDKCGSGEKGMQVDSEVEIGAVGGVQVPQEKAVAKRTQTPKVTPRMKTIAEDVDDSDEEDLLDSEDEELELDRTKKAKQRSEAKPLTDAEDDPLWEGEGDEIGEFEMDGVPPELQVKLTDLKLQLLPYSSTAPGSLRKKKKGRGQTVAENIIATSNRYRHRSGNHQSVGAGLTLLPFDIYACPAFYDYLRTLGIDILDRVPSREEFLTKLEELKEEYPEYLRKSRLWKEKQKGKPQFASQAWDKEYKEWWFQWPLREPKEKKQRNRAATQARLEKAAFEQAEKADAVKHARKAEGKQVAEGKAAKRPVGRPKGKKTNRNREKTPPPPTAALPPPAVSRPPATPQAASIPSQSQVFGCQFSKLPPPVVRLISNAFRPVYLAFAIAVSRIAERDEILLSKQPPEVRGSTEAYSIPIRMQEAGLEAFFRLFGGHAAYTLPGRICKAPGPPGSGEIPGYSNTLGQTLNHFLYVFNKGEKSKMARYKGWDEECERLLSQLRDPTRLDSLERGEVEYWARVVTRAVEPYEREGIQKPSWVQAVQTRFWIAAQQWMLLASSDTQDANVKAYLEALRSAEEGQKEEWAVEEEVQGGMRRYVEKAAMNADDTEPRITNPAESELGELGVGAYAKWDNWDCAEHLGLLGEQEEEALGLVESLSKEEAHAFQTDDDGKIQWVNPRYHSARSNIIIPGMKRWEDEPRDLVLYEEAKKANPDLPRDDTHFDRIYPARHQLVALVSMFDRGYANHPLNPTHAQTILADDVGLGKTMIFLLFVAIRRYHKEKRAKNPTWRAPCMDAFKAWLVPSGKNDKGDEYAELAKEVKREQYANLPPQWIGDKRKKPLSHRISISMFLASPTVQASHLKEMHRFLDGTKFKVVEMGPDSRGSPAAREGFMNRILDDYAGKEVIISATYTSLLAHSSDHPIDSFGNPAATTGKSIFRSDFSYNLLVADEIHELRNPANASSGAIQRISLQAQYAIAATATPIFTSALDIVTAARNILIPVVHNPGKTPKNANISLPLQEGKKEGQKEASEDQQREKPDIRDPAYFANSTEWVKSLVFNNRQIQARRAKNKKEWSSLQELAPGLRGETAVEKRLAKEGAEQEFMVEDEADIDAALVDPEISPERRKYLETKRQLLKRMQSEVIGQIQYFLGPYIIRRLRTSLDQHGLPIITYQIPEITEVWVNMGPIERHNYLRLQSAHSKDSNFQSLGRRYTTEPFAVMNGWFDPSAPMSAKISKLIQLIARIVEEDKDLPEIQRRKILIHMNWTGLLPFVKARLCMAGHPVASLSGKTSTANRSAIVNAFQRDDSHMSDPVAWCQGSNEVRISGSVKTRIMIITSVASAGLSLFRASELVTLDPGWSNEEAAQITGRIVRRGQTRECHLYAIFVHHTTDEWMSGLAMNKRDTAKLLLQGPLGGTTHAFSRDEGLPGLEGDLPGMATIKRHQERQGRQRDTQRQRQLLKGLATPRIVDELQTADEDLEVQPLVFYDPKKRQMVVSEDDAENDVAGTQAGPLGLLRIEDDVLNARSRGLKRISETEEDDQGQKRTKTGTDEE